MHGSLLFKNINDETVTKLINFQKAAIANGRSAQLSDALAKDLGAKLISIKAQVQYIVLSDTREFASFLIHDDTVEAKQELLEITLKAVQLKTVGTDTAFAIPHLRRLGDEQSEQQCLVISLMGRCCPALAHAARVLVELRAAPESALTFDGKVMLELAAETGALDTVLQTRTGAEAKRWDTCFLSIADGTGKHSSTLDNIFQPQFILPSLLAQMRTVQSSFHDFLQEQLTLRTELVLKRCPDWFENKDDLFEHPELLHKLRFNPEWDNLNIAVKEIKPWNELAKKLQKLRVMVPTSAINVAKRAKNFGNDTICITYAIWSITTSIVGTSNPAIRSEKVKELRKRLAAKKYDVEEHSTLTTFCASCSMQRTQQHLS